MVGHVEGTHEVVLNAAGSTLTGVGIRVADDLHRQSVGLLDRLLSTGRGRQSVENVLQAASEGPAGPS